MVVDGLIVEGDGSTLLQRALQQCHYSVDGQPGIGVPIVVLELEADAAGGLQDHETGGRPQGVLAIDGGFVEGVGKVHDLSMRRRRDLASPVLLQPRDVINVQVKQGSKLLVIEEPRKAPNLSPRQSIRGAERMRKNAA